MERARWRDRRVVITGGTSGLGLALARALHARGAKVGVVARGRERIDALEAAHASIIGVVGDVGRKEDIHPIAMQLVGRLGGVDVLVNNASSLGPVPLRPWADTECEDLEVALATNVLGPHRLTRALLGPLLESRAGVVINVSSDAAVSAYAGWGAYSASKAALLHATKIWDEELRARGVRFGSFDPGDMDTPMHAQALPDADASTLKRPETSAAELIATVEALWSEARASEVTR
ncbi:MAG: SDR family oxidoreductase [Myxococcota bacterium]|nr:SDR family oxidoreductase [Myxococcota bacterium]